MAVPPLLPEPSSVVNPDEWDLRLGSPSKINLFLRVMGKRPDGKSQNASLTPNPLHESLKSPSPPMITQTPPNFHSLSTGYHELASLFQSISLKDDVYFSKKTHSDPNPQADSLECDNPDIPTDDSNLILRALSKFRQHTGIGHYFRIRLEKRIPHEAGLGGGSSNAATALWAANELSDRPCSTKQLAELGAEFGSDISFFLSNGTAYCTGRGEILEELPRLKPQTLYVVKPKEGLSTKEVFQNLRLDECSERDPKELLEKMQKGVIFADFVNDLEKPSFKLIPRLAEIKEKLYYAGFNVSLLPGELILCFLRESLDCGCTDSVCCSFNCLFVRCFVGRVNEWERDVVFLPGASSRERLYERVSCRERRSNI